MHYFLDIYLGRILDLRRQFKELLGCGFCRRFHHRPRHLATSEPNLSAAVVGPRDGSEEAEADVDHARWAFPLEKRGT